MTGDELYKALFQNILNGFAHCKLIYDGGRAVDWEYVTVNAAFERQTGLIGVEGKRVSQVIPGIHERNPELLETYERVVGTRVPERFETYVEELQIWFDVSAYCVEAGTFTAVFDNITERRKLESDLEYKDHALMQAYNETISSWSRAMELREIYTADHSERMIKLTYRLMHALNFFPPYMEKIKYGVQLHDVGKLFIPLSIMSKPGPLTAEERAVMRKHPENAYQILKNIYYLREVIDIPHYHHEKWNGSGYPEGLAEHRIPLEVRIFSVIDVYDSMIHDRPYRRGIKREQVLDHIASEREHSFDPVVADKFLEMTQELL